MKTFTALLMIGTIALAACGSSDDNSSSASSSSSAGGSTSASSGGGYGGGYGSGSSKKSTSNASTSSKPGETEVEMYDDYFQPKTISGKPGSTVKVELKNEGQREHNFKIDGQKADADVEPGEDSKVSVVIPKSGSVQFYCEYHKGLGMTGTVKAT
jgi:plastocyanin